MDDSALAKILGRAATPAEAIQWACKLEATAPKAGNVYPGKSFDDLDYDDFVRAAESTANAFDDTNKSVAQRALQAVSQVRQTSSNVNLGIVLLLVPLVAADEETEIVDFESWHPPITKFLQELGPSDSRLLFQTIQMASAGGLDEVDEMDVRDSTQHDDIIAAMRLAESRDRIAKQYSSGYRDFFNNVVPVIFQCLSSTKELLSGISTAHLQLLAAHPDSLIARKCGPHTAGQVQKRASLIDLANQTQRDEFDRYLRSKGNRLNPGTTADLIATALYVLMRTPGSTWPIRREKSGNHTNHK